MKSKINNQSGFSLVQLLIAIIIVSIGLAAAAKLATMQFQKDREERIDQSFEEINDLLLSYYTGVDADGNKNKRLPCPARRNLAIDDPNFGTENCSAATIVNHQTLTHPDTGFPLRVMIGALPARILSMPIENAYDVFDGQILYAVSEEMTSPTNFGRNDLASIQRQDVSGAVLGQPLPFLVISAGETGYGTYNKNGTLIENCPTTGNEKENCNNDAIFIDTEIAEGEANPNNFFDDRLGFDGTFFSRVAQTILINAQCPSGQFLSGLNAGQPECGKPSGGECENADKNGSTCNNPVSGCVNCSDKGDKCVGSLICGVCSNARCIAGGGSR